MAGYSRKTIASIIVLGSMFVALSAGCGTRVGPLDEPTDDSGAASPTPAPSASASAAPGPVPSTAPVVPTPGPQLQASQKDFKKGALWGVWSKAQVDVMVTNPSGQTLSGTLKVTFMKGSSPTEDQSRQVSLGANQTETIQFKATKGNPDSATVDVQTDAPVAPAPNPAGYGGQTPAYGSPYVAPYGRY